MKRSSKRRFRSRPGVVALREIKKYQRSTDLLVPRLPFQRVVKEITGKINSDLRFSVQGLIALQECTESFMTDWSVRGFLNVLNPSQESHTGAKRRACNSPGGSEASGSEHTKVARDLKNKTQLIFSIYKGFVI